jgi:hypothetical protein
VSRQCRRSKFVNRVGSKLHDASCIAMNSVRYEDAERDPYYQNSPDCRAQLCKGFIAKERLLGKSSFEVPDVK